METHDSPNRLDRLTRAVHAQQAAERQVERARRASELEARRRSPGELGLVQCPDCGWWREALPDEALLSPQALRNWLARARAFCMCTASRCGQCGERMLDHCPTPRYFSESRGVIVNCSGLTTGLAHAQRCSAGEVAVEDRM